MEIKQLESIVEKYKDIGVQLNKLEGEESQLFKEKEHFIDKIKELGYQSVEEFTTGIDVIENEIKNLIGQIEKDII